MWLFFARLQYGFSIVVVSEIISSASFFPAIQTLGEGSEAKGRRTGANPGENESRLV
jgi:hypothetical protein